MVSLKVVKQQEQNNKTHPADLGGAFLLTLKSSAPSNTQQINTDHPVRRAGSQTGQQSDTCMV